MRSWQRRLVGALVFVSLCLPAGFAANTEAQGRGGRGGQMPGRDAMRPLPEGTAVLSGRVTAIDNGRPVKRARVVVTGGPRPFSTTTDDEGRFLVERLPAASYTITASKTGFVNGVYGQRRAGAPGTPVPLADGQQVTSLELRLMRGGVITGRVVDDDGDPLAQAVVTVYRQQFVRGERQLSPAGVDQSDDRGQYRVFGLPPGDYFVSANAGGIERLAQQFLPMVGMGEAAAESTGYAATYYPGVIESGQAARVRLDAGQELSGIDFPLQLVPLATVRGVVAGGAATVMLLPEGGPSAGFGGGRGGGRGGMASIGGDGGGLGAVIGAAIGGALRGGSLRATTRADGTFAIPNVTPGRYTIVARAGDGPSAATAIQPITVSGSEISVALAPAPGVMAAGTVTLEAGGAVPAALTGFRVSLTPLGAVAAVPGQARPAQSNERGEFTLTDVIPGQYLIQGAGPQGWTMKAVYVDGRDATDRAVEISAPGAGAINVIFTDRLATLSGSVRQGAAAAAGLTVVAYAADESYWHPHSRHILSARTDASGAYRFGVIPPGDYLVVAVDDVEQGEWFDPSFLDRMRKHAAKVRIGEGDQPVQDLRPAGS